MKKIIICLVWVLGYFNGYEIIAQSKTAQENLRSFVKYFIEAEFNGEEDARMNTVVYSESRLKKVKRNDPELIGQIISIDGDPLIIVKSFEIFQLDSTEMNGKAIIKFQKVAYTKGLGAINRKVIIDEKVEVISVLLKYKNKKWWIIDPSFPRVSLQAIIKYTENEITTLSKLISPSENQRKKLLKLQETYNTYISLRSKIKN